MLRPANAAFTHPVDVLHHTDTAIEPSAALPAHQAHHHHTPPQDDTLHPVFTNHAIKSAPLLPAVLAAQPCAHLPLNVNVQLVKSQLPCTLICNRQFVGVIVRTLAALPAAQDV